MIFFNQKNKKETSIGLTHGYVYKKSGGEKMYNNNKKSFWVTMLVFLAVIAMVIYFWTSNPASTTLDQHESEASLSGAHKIVLLGKVDPF